jgi:trigger factor
VKTEVQSVAENEVLLSVEVPQDEVDRRYERTLTRIAREANLAGFRKGRVPKQIIVQRFGTDYVLSETLQDALPEWYEQALDATEVDAVSQPELDLGDLVQGQPFSFSAKVQVKPTPALGQYMGVEAPKQSAEVDEAQVDAQMEMFRERLASLKPIEDRPAQNGDYVLIDFTGRTEDGPLEGGDATDYALELGSGQLVPGFEEELAGMSVGDEKQFTVTFPDDYHEESLKAKPVTFAVTLKDVKERVVPELSDQFASEVSEFETLADLRKDVRERLEQMRAETVERDYRSAVIEKVSENAQVEVPPAMVQREAHELLHELEHAVGEQGMAFDAYLNAVGKTPEQVQEELMPRAEASVRRRLVLEQVAKAEGLEVTDDDIRERIRADAEVIGRDGNQLILDIYAAGRQESIRDDMLMAKAVDLLVENAVAVEPAESETEDEDEAETPVAGTVEEPPASGSSM